jgi:hypothetical protein
MMPRALWLWLCLALGFGFGVYELKLRVQGVEERLARVNRLIFDDEEAIHVLKAEWSYMNEPERIDALARRYLDLGPLSGKQYGSIADLPQRATPDASERGPLPEAGPGASRLATPPLPVPTARPRLPKGAQVTLAREVR